MSKKASVLVAAAFAYGALPAQASDSGHITVRSVVVENARVEAAPNSEGAPCALVKFDLLNKGVTMVREPTLRISVVEKTDTHTAVPQRKVLVRPFVVRGINVALEAGHSFSYEMLLRNFSSDCNCVPYVEVLPAATGPVVDSAREN